MFDELRINLTLLILNIVALGNFVYPPRNEFLIILVLLMIFPLPYSVKVKMRIVTLLSLISSFMVGQILCELSCIVALGIAINTAYELDLTEGPAMINTALGISQILSFWTHQYLQKNTINRDITLLIFTLPNLFLCLDCQISASKVLFLINPLFDDKWLYSVGFVLGIYTTSLTSIEKHYKFFCISIILLIEASLPQQIDLVDGILAFLRGLLIYTQHAHKSEMYFLILLLFVKILFREYLFYFMFIGYLVIGVILFQESRQRKQRRHTRKDESVGTLELLNQMYQLNQFKPR